MSAEKLTKAERIAIGAAVAPTVRRAADAPRKVTVIGKDGKPIRETTHVEVAKAVLARSEIEFSVQPGKRPEYVACKACGHPIRVPPKGSVPIKCKPGAMTPCGRPESAEERAADYQRMLRFAADRGLPDEWAVTVYAAKYGRLPEESTR